MRLLQTSEAITVNLTLFSLNAAYYSQETLSSTWSPNDLMENLTRSSEELYNNKGTVALSGKEVTAITGLFSVTANGKYQGFCGL